MSGLNRAFHHPILQFTLTGFILLMSSACTTPKDPLTAAPFVDLNAFMGAWYVVGYTPILVDHKAHNAVEHYYRVNETEIATTYQFRKGGFDGKLKTYKPTGTVVDTQSNAEWRMQFIWPFKAPYIIMVYNEEEGVTLIGHPNRKYAWIMQREPEVNPTLYNRMLSILKDAGYDTSRIQTIPHDWSSDSERLARLKQVGSSQPLAPR